MLVGVLGLDHTAKVGDDRLHQMRREVLDGDALGLSVELQLAVLADGAADKHLDAGHRLRLAARRVELLGGPAHQANVGCLHLAARVRAARPVDAHVTRHVDARLHLLGDQLRVALRLDHREATELRASAADEVADDAAGLGAQPRIAVEGRLGEEGGHLVVRHVGQNDVLLDGQSDLAAGHVALGEVGDIARLLHGEAADGHVDADAREPLLGLRVHAKVGGDGAAARLRALVRRGGARLLLVDEGVQALAVRRYLRDDSLTVRAVAARMAFDLRHRAVRLDKPHEPRLLPVLARALVAEDAQDGARELDGDVDARGDPQAHVDGLGHALGRHVAAEHDVETHLARDRVCARLVANVVDVCVRKVVAPAAHRNVELARQVAPHGVAALACLLVQGDQVVERVAEGARVDHLVHVDAREWRAHHVTHIV
mmetsp:Transcript_23703/g.58611  ORF Transcript_23703/g.58611 Transcript_23703/m.58611 type:complete len:429 (+) Transcript_23703:117-1403(+)